VKAKLAMTGEITLRGKVLPVGGIKKRYLQQNVLILKKFLLSKENKRDIDDIKKRLHQRINFYLC